MKFINLSKRYKKELFTGLNGTFNTGLFYIDGKSGSGKTTLLNVISKEAKPSKGLIKLEENAVVSYLKSEGNLNNEISLNENFAYLKDNSKYVFDNDAFNSLISLFHFESKAKEKVLYLSSGERKIANLITILSIKSDYILLDEPFSTLSEENINILVEYLIKIKDTVGIFIVNHLDHIKMDYDSIIDLNENKITFKDDVRRKKQRDNNAYKKPHLVKIGVDYNKKNLVFTIFVGIFLALISCIFSVANFSFFKSNDYNLKFIKETYNQDSINLYGENFKFSDYKDPDILYLNTDAISNILYDSNNHIKPPSVDIIGTRYLNDNEYVINSNSGQLNFSAENYKIVDFGEFFEIHNEQIFKTSNEELIVSISTFNKIFLDNFKDLAFGENKFNFNIMVETARFNEFKIIEERKILGIKDYQDSNYKIALNSDYTINFYNLPITRFNSNENVISRDFVLESLIATKNIKFIVNKNRIEIFNSNNIEYNVGSLRYFFSNDFEENIWGNTRFLISLFAILSGSVLFLAFCVFMVYFENKKVNSNQKMNNLKMFTRDNKEISLISNSYLIVAVALSILISVSIETFAFPAIFNGFYQSKYGASFINEGYVGLIQYFKVNYLDILISILTPVIFIALLLLGKKLFKNVKLFNKK